MFACFGSTASSFWPFLKKFFSGFAGCWKKERKRNWNLFFFFAQFSYGFETRFGSKGTIFHFSVKKSFPSTRCLLKAKWWNDLSSLKENQSDEQWLLNNWSVSLVVQWIHKREYLPNRPDARNHFDHLYHPNECVIVGHLSPQLCQYTKNLDFADRWIQVYHWYWIHWLEELKPARRFVFLTDDLEEKKYLLVEN